MKRLTRAAGSTDDLDAQISPFGPDLGMKKSALNGVLGLELDAIMNIPSFGLF